MRGPLLARDAVTGGVSQCFPDNERLTLVDPGVDGRHAVVGRSLASGERLFVHAAASGAIVAELPREGLQVSVNGQPPYFAEHFVEFLPDGRRILYADRNGEQLSLRVWDLHARRQVAAIADAWLPATCSPDGRVVAYTSHVRNRGGWRVCLWDIDQGTTRELGSAPRRNYQPVRLRFSPDGQTVVSVLEFRGQMLGREQRDEVTGWDVTSGSQSFRRPVPKARLLANVPWFFTEECEVRP
jgi:hypothetical protein